MTDKQIIIDGVDVSGCPHYIHKDGSCSSQDCECIKCIHNVCFYKDYKAKEQECEELKQTLTEIKEIAENVQSFVGRINIEDDVFEQMEQILQKISEMNHDL